MSLRLHGLAALSGHPPTPQPHSLVPPSTWGLTKCGSPLSTAEVLRAGAGLFCGPVGTAMRKQKLRSWAEGAGGEALPGAGWGGVGVRLAEGWKQGTLPSSPGMRRKQTARGPRYRMPTPPVQAGHQERRTGRGCSYPELMGNGACWSFN